VEEKTPERMDGAGMVDHQRSERSPVNTILGFSGGRGRHSYQIGRYWHEVAGHPKGCQKHTWRGANSPLGVGLGLELVSLDHEEGLSVLM
jgi:hypothetical protein